MDSKLFTLISAVVILASPSVFADRDLTIRSATVIDGLGGPAQNDVDIEIIDGRIARIGPHLKSSVNHTLDARRSYVMPGLIDAHTHLHSVPGAIYRKDSSEEIKIQQQLQLKSYVAAGVTTVLDAAAAESIFNEARNRGPAEVAPHVLGLAPFLTPSGGYFGNEVARDHMYGDLWPPIRDAAEVAKYFEKASVLNPVGAKVTMESGFGPFDTWPVFDQKMRAEIVAQAEKFKSPIFVHSMSKEEDLLALSLKPYAFVHAGFYLRLPDQEILQKIKDSGAFVISTLAIYKLTLLMWDREFLNDPWIKMLVPARQLETAKDAVASKWIVEQVIIQSRPKWLPAFAARWMAGLFLSKWASGGQLEKSSKAVKMMYDRGIPLVMGSDSGNWPVWSTFFHGVGSVLEMELLADAGLPPGEVIVAATSRAARMLKIDKDVGSIEVGKVADLLVLSQNPLEEKKAFRNIQFVIKGGVARTPSQWMK